MKEIKAVLRLVEITFLVILLPLSIQATHIVGGEMSYTCIRPNVFQISLTMRRDCINGQAAFDAFANIAVFQKEGNGFRLATQVGRAGIISIPYMGNDTINETITSACGVLGGDVCVETTTYLADVDIPLNPGGYLFVYQRCCRNHTIQNIELPEEAGMTVFVEMSEEAIKTCNSSPKFKEWPPVYLCGEKEFIMDHSAIDQEGDSIVYTLCTPLHGGSRADPAPNPADAPPYDPVIFRSPFSLQDVIGGSVPLQIDARTGRLRVTPNSLIEQHVGAICMEEYRNGVLLSKTQRDFQLNVRICSPSPKSIFKASEVLCDGERMPDFINASIHANRYLWYFDYPRTTWSSTMQDPDFVYPASGKYRIALIAFGEQDCKDTSYADIVIYDPDDLVADFDFRVNFCLDSVSVRFIDQSVDKFGSIVKWSWTILLNGKLYSSNLRSPAFIFKEDGLANVILQIQSSNGCNVVIAKQVPVERIKFSIIDGPVKICKGDSIALLKNFDPNLTYRWSPNLFLSCTNCPDVVAFPDTTTVYTLEVSNGLCTVDAKVEVLVEICHVLTCNIRVEQLCLPNGMVELRALDKEGKLIIPALRKQEIFWNIKDGPGTKYYSVVQTNPVVVSNHSRYCATLKTYSWAANVPKTIEFAEICQQTSCDTISNPCPGPCEDFTFLLSSREDDYDVLNNLDYPSAFCKSVCYNSCDYIVGIFDLQGNVIDPNAYVIKWSTGETGEYSFQQGCFKNYLAVEVRKGDCVWFGRYRASCELYTGKMWGLQTENDKLGFDFSLVQRETQKKANRIWIVNSLGQRVGYYPDDQPNLKPGIYFLISNGDKFHQTKVLFQQ